MNVDDIQGKFLQKQPLFIGEDTAFRSAVVVPLVEVNGETHVLFEVRSMTMRKQPGDISFPGGKIDPTDRNPEEAALRELYEELSVPPSSTEVLSALSPLIISPAFVIYPFVAKVDMREVNTLNRDEVHEVFTVPLDWLIQYEPELHHVLMKPTPSEGFPFDKIMNGKDYEWRARAIDEWFFDYNGYVIWGLTARILKYFLERLKA
ncbi:NUDIX hydrolase [Kurthia massiliensis]|uniref:NUDIX hydrolase n=1 Tax=Kurthia massiliensis TaxID=1033739 RepID=UPI000289689C|nr:CoA pyrophosphatase [Kurthia massiliensis]